MKKIARLLAVVMSVVISWGTAYADDDIRLGYEELPQKAKTFITKHFGTAPKIQEIEFDRVENEYSVELRNGYDIKFDKKGAVVEIDSPDMKDLKTTIVKDILPSKAVSYLIKEKSLGDVDDIKVLPNGDYLVEIDKMTKDKNLRFDKTGKLKK